jgi:hypothetical protein
MSKNFRDVRPKPAPATFFNEFANWEADKNLSDIADLVYTLYTSNSCRTYTQPEQKKKKPAPVTPELPQELEELLDGYKVYARSKYTVETARSYIGSAKMLLHFAHKTGQSVNSPATIDQFLATKRDNTITYRNLLISTMTGFFKFNHLTDAIQHLREIKSRMNREADDVTEQV